MKNLFPIFKSPNRLFVGFFLAGFKHMSGTIKHSHSDITVGKLSYTDANSSVCTLVQAQLGGITRDAACLRRAARENTARCFGVSKEGNRLIFHERCPSSLWKNSSLSCSSEHTSRRQKKPDGSTGLGWRDPPEPARKLLTSCCMEWLPFLMVLPRTWATMIHPPDNLTKAPPP